MPSRLPVRGVGDVGVVTDMAAAQLPPQAFTRAKNVRFDEGAVVRAPVFRRVKSIHPNIPRFAYGTTTSSNVGSIIFLDSTFDIREYSNGVVTADLAKSLTSINDPFTATKLAGTIYINRKDSVPVYRNTAANFADIPTQTGAGAQWQDDWRAKAFRSYGDFLIALNLTYSSTSEYLPNRVQWSDIALAGTTPPEWNPSSTTNSAGFNDITSMKTPIVDGLTLNNSFIIYSKDQVWSMDFVGGTFIFNFRKLFTETGLINQNCVAEVDGKHFCFGIDDIYTHDGNSITSICDQRVKNYIFNGLRNDKTQECFVHHNPVLEEVYFCYNSQDDMEKFEGGTRCNRAAVFNYKNNTWTFLDLPNITSATMASLENSLSYNTAEDSEGNEFLYSDVGGTYLSQEAKFSQHNVLVGTSNPGTQGYGVVGFDGVIYALDSSQDNTLVNFPIDANATIHPFLERVGIDIDEQIDLSGYKILTKITPQCHTNSSNKEFIFSFGAADLVNDTTDYESSVTFDANATHKIDTRAAGRYLSYKMELSDYKDFKYLGFDADLTLTGRR